MNTVEAELNKNGINVLCPLNEKITNQIANYVADTLSSKFPDLKLNYKTLYMSISKLNMYLADMPTSTAGASYYYKNASIYFRNGMKLGEMKKVAVHECIHHFQEIKDAKGTLHRLGLCSYLGNRAYGNALNEAAVQLMSTYATGEQHDTVTYYGISLPTDSPSYYPLICNLIKQIGYITGFSSLFESTFFSNDVFFDKFKKAIGENNAFKVQSNFERILSLEQRINKLSNKVKSEDLSYRKFKKCTDLIEKSKTNIQKTFLSTQNIIIKAFFDEKIKQVSNVNHVEQYRKYLYSFINLIGTTPSYTFFNDYYINKMATLDQMYEGYNGNTSLTVVKKSKLSMILQAIRNLMFGKSGEYENEK